MYVQKLFWRVKNLPLLHKTIGISLIAHVCVIAGMLVQRIPEMIKLRMNEKRFVAAEVLFDVFSKKSSMSPEHGDHEKNKKSMLNEQTKMAKTRPKISSAKKQDAKKEAALKKSKMAEKVQSKKEVHAKKKKALEMPPKAPPIVQPSIKTKNEKVHPAKWNVDMPVAYELVVAEIKKAIEAVWQLPKNVTHVACVVAITLSNLGKVLDIKMVKSSEVPAFDLAVLASIKKATFPAACWGRTIEITIG